jgi:hypothetical protein
MCSPETAQVRAHRAEGWLELVGETRARPPREGGPAAWARCRGPRPGTMRTPVVSSPTPNTHPQLAEVYSRREAAETAVTTALDRRAWWLGTAKVALVAGGIGAVLTLGFGLLWVSLAAAAFVVLAVVHGRVLRRLDWHRRLAALNQREQRALWREASFALTWDGPTDGNHRYADDLEILAERGLFCHVNRGLTAMGRRTLAAWLSAAAGPEEVLSRQSAARELASQIDHRQTLAAHGLPGERAESQARAAGLFSAMASGMQLVTMSPAMLYALPIATLITGVLSLSLAGLGRAFLGLLTVQLVLNLVFAKRVARLLREASGCARVLEAYGSMLRVIEVHSCESPRLRELQQRLTSGGVRASDALRRLATVLQWMDVRSAPMIHGPLNALLLWDLHGAQRIAAWQRCFRAAIPRWLAVIGEWEALSSLAALAFNNSGWVWPVMCARGHGLLAEGLGHPLIPDAERVTSDVELAGRGTIWIVTGPNMAGKSTFLRTVGVNLALAQAGAPVCARHFALEPLELITSMRISDSLDKRLSLFYAELQRLKQILDAVERGEPVFFLIDEMLKGTNTLDRQAGALALVRQLQRDGACGIVATHDLALARLADERPGSLFNRHFDGTVEGERLVFDYRLRDGACERFNALSLMRAIGIRLDECGRALSE